MTADWDHLEMLLMAHRATRPFTEGELNGLPEPVRRYFMAAVEVGTPLAAGVRLRMRGHIKVGRWLPFRARQLLAPRHGMVWVARVAGVISGSDRYLDGSGAMDWRLVRGIRLVHAEGADVSRSAAGRVAGESIWLPTALAPSTGAVWSAPDHQHIGVDVGVGDQQVRLHHEIDDRGRIRASWFKRWGDPDNTGSWALYPFGLEVTDYHTFGRVSIPSAGRAGWHFGTDRWNSGEFFRYQITAYELVA